MCSMVLPCTSFAMSTGELRLTHRGLGAVQGTAWHLSVFFHWLTRVLALIGARELRLPLQQLPARSRIESGLEVRTKAKSGSTMTRLVTCSMLAGNPLVAGGRANSAVRCI